MVPPLGEIAAYARRLGPRRAVARGAYVLLNQAGRFEVLHCLRLREQDANPAYLDAGPYDARLLEAAEVVALAEDAANGLPEPPVLEAMLARGDLCYGILDGGKLANVSFYASRPVPIYEDLEVRFDPARWYMHGAWTPPAWRGERLHAVGVVRAFRELRARGVRELVGTIEWTNHRSLVSARRMGWRPSGAIWHVRAAGHRRLGATRAARALGMHLAPRAERAP